MAITALEQWSTTAASNVDLNSIPIDGAVTTPSQVDNLFRELMAQVAVQVGEMNFEGADIASAATTNLATATGWSLDITGTTTITALGTVNAGHLFILRFVDALTLTHNATSLILPGAANITTVAGDVAWMKSEGSGNWRCVHYMRAAGVATVGPASSTDNALARYNGTVGAIQNSNATLDDSGNLLAAGSITSNTGVFDGAGGQALLGVVGTVALRPQGTGSATNQTTIDSSGNMSVSGAISTTANITGDQFVGTGADAYLATGSAGSVALRPNGPASSTGQMTVDSSGNVASSGDVLVGDDLLVGHQAVISMADAQFGVSLENTGLMQVARDNAVAAQFKRTNTGALINFFQDTTNSGNISVSGGTTAYNTTSDYRLKDNIRDLEGSGAFIDALRPRTFEWLSTGQTASGFIAHEFAAVSPTSVTGEKDGESHQAMQASTAEVMANVVKELQTLRARMAALES
jgi:hypothetical protein